MTRPQAVEHDHNKENMPAGQGEVRTHGAIVKIIFKSFLTYDDVTFKPGPYLNVVIGPNGTGKSTILCGMCLALGGDTKLLGRSTEYNDFIKHGKPHGSVEVELWDSTIDKVRRFSIHLKDKKRPTYSIDGKPETKENVLREIRAYNIQVDNPCVFLAQDKVASFAQQTSMMKLRNTERAGPVELLSLHEQMEQMVNEGGSFDQQVANAERNLKDLKKDLEKLRPRREFYRQRIHGRGRIDLLNKKKAYLEYEAKVAAMRAAGDEVRQAEAKLRNAKNRVNPLEGSIEKVKEQRKKIDNDLEGAKKKVSISKGYIEERMGDNSIEQKLAECIAIYDRAKQDEANWERTKAELIKQCDEMGGRYEHERKQLQIDPEFDRRRAECQRETQRLADEERQLAAEEHQLDIEKRGLEAAIRDQQDNMKRKLNYLIQSEGAGVGDAWRFYQENKNQFRYEVYVPFLHLTVRDQAYLKYLNNSIGKRDSTVFIFGCSEDENLLMAGNKYRISSSIVSPQMLDRYRERATLPPDLRNLGFSRLVSECFDAPEHVYAYLCSISKLDLIPIGNQQVDHNSEEIARNLKDTPYSVFLTDMTRISTGTSRYDRNQFYVNRDPLRARQGFMYQRESLFRSEDLRPRKQGYEIAVEAHRGRREQYRQRKQANDVTRGTIRQQEGVHSRQAGVVEAQKARWDRSKEKVDDHIRRKPDLGEATRGYEQTREHILGEAIQRAEELADRFAVMRGQIVEGALSSLENMRLGRSLHLMRQQKEQQHGEELELEERVKTTKMTLDKKKAEANHEKSKLMTHAKIQTTGNSAELSESERRQLRKLEEEFQQNDVPNDINEIQRLIEEQTNELQAQEGEGSKKDADDCDKAEADEAKIVQQIEELKSRRDNWEQTMDEKLKLWLDPLKKLVDDIDQEYSKLLRRLGGHLGYEGKVKIKVPEQKYKANDYGIDILVKFRQESDLTLLDSRTQSGGERSVSTMLYLMALQNICYVPFRCVDEINQGMDERNERMVFNMMTQLLADKESQLSKTQYFLLTPKLLRGLEYTDQVTVHIVHNGPAMENVKSWDPLKFLQQSRDEP